MKIKVKLYACRYTNLISANMEDFIPIAYDSGDIETFSAYVARKMPCCQLLDYLITCAEQNMSCEHALQVIRQEYDDHMVKVIAELFEVGDDFWSEEVEVELPMKNKED